MHEADVTFSRLTCPAVLIHIPENVTWYIPEVSTCTTPTAPSTWWMPEDSEDGRLSGTGVVSGGTTKNMLLCANTARVVAVVRSVRPAVQAAPADQPRPRTACYCSRPEPWVCPSSGSNVPPSKGRLSSRWTRPYAALPSVAAWQMR